MAEEDDGGGVGTDENRADESFEVVHCCLIAKNRLALAIVLVSRENSENLRRIVCIEFDNDEVGDIRQMVRVAETKVARVGSAHSAVRQLCSWMREHGVPPLEEL